MKTNDFTASFFNRSNEEVAVPPAFTIVPQWYTWEAQGGCATADVLIYGESEALWQVLPWLGYKVVIYNRNLSPVWWGFAEEIIIRRPGAQIGLSLKDMRNRVAVAYTVEELGESIRGTTAWADNTDSQNLYDIKEVLLSQSDMTADSAEAFRDWRLAQVGLPVLLRSFGSEREPHAVLRCAGQFAKFSWRYYPQLHGLEINDEGNGANQIVGLGLTSSTVGFSKSGKASEWTGGFQFFQTDTRIRVTGTTSNNGDFDITDADQDEFKSYTSNTIGFDPADDIMEDEGGLGFIQVDDYFTVSGAGQAVNNGLKRCLESGAEHLVVAPRTITAEAAGATVTITRGNSITLSGTHPNETPASTTIVVYGQKVAQSFSLEHNLSWTVNKVAIRAMRTGLPADSLKVELCADSAGAPGTVLDSATLTAANIAIAMEWSTFQLANTQTITYGTTYWLVVSRTGADDANEFYAVEVDEELPYARGAMLLWTGAAWVVRAIDADMLFRVMGAWETSRQIAQLVTDIGQDIDGIDQQVNSGIYTHQYRAGETTGHDELLPLLETGTTNGRRMLAEVTLENIFVFREQPAEPTEARYFYDTEGGKGRLLDPSGQPLEHGQLVVGDWVHLADIPPIVAEALKVSPFVVEQAEYDCFTNEVKIEPMGASDIWAVGMVAQG